jgi:hypothetical protein
MTDTIYVIWVILALLFLVMLDKTKRMDLKILIKMSIIVGFLTYAFMVLGAFI